jgi:hypothetical protein
MLRNLSAIAGGREEAVVMDVQGRWPCRLPPYISEFVEIEPVTVATGMCSGLGVIFFNI